MQKGESSVIEQQGLTVDGSLAPASEQLDVPHVLETKASPHDARRTYGRLTVAIAISDAFAAALALTIVKTFFDPGNHFGNQSLVFGFLVVGWVAVYFLYGLYSPRHLSATDEFRRLFGASSLGMCILVLAGFWSQTAIPRSVVGLFWILATAFELLSRRIWRLEIARRKETGSLALRTLVVGTNDEARDIWGQLQTRGSGYEPVGYIASGSTHVLNDNIDVVTGIRGVEHILQDQNIECLFIASSALSPDEVSRVMTAARQAEIDIRVSANLPDILSTRLAVQPVGSSLALSVRPMRLTRAQSIAKRAFDIAVSIATIALTAPIWMVIAAVIKLTSDGPVLFRQVRVTKGGQRFNMVKFRTMYDSTDAALDIDTSTPFFKLENDPRTTPIGRFLRRFSLDELPQLINVLNGEMSLVGPRPLPVDQVESHPELLGGRLEVQAGMTGWWQIQGRSEVSAEAAVRLDVFYVENWSLSLDLYILLKTFGAVVTRSGAY